MVAFTDIDAASALSNDLADASPQWLLLRHGGCTCRGFVLGWCLAGIFARSLDLLRASVRLAGLTLVDALDTMWIMNLPEFDEAVEWVVCFSCTR